MSRVKEMMCSRPAAPGMAPGMARGMARGVAPAFTAVLALAGVFAVSAAGGGLGSTMADPGFGGLQAAPEAPMVFVHRSDAGGIDLTVSTDGVGAETIWLQGGRYTVLDWPESPFCGEFGAPALPVIRRILSVAPGTEVRLSVQAGQAREIDPAGLGYPDPVLPRQPLPSQGPDGLVAVSYTHLTLPTKRIV